MKNTQKLHLVTQRNQPYGSSRKCCERCGLAITHFEDGAYCTEAEWYETQVSEESGIKYIPCNDKMWKKGE